MLLFAFVGNEYNFTTMFGHVKPDNDQTKLFWSCWSSARTSKWHQLLCWNDWNSILAPLSIIYIIVLTGIEFRIESINLQSGAVLCYWIIGIGFNGRRRKRIRLFRIPVIAKPISWIFNLIESIEIYNYFLNKCVVFLATWFDSLAGVFDIDSASWNYISTGSRNCKQGYARRHRLWCYGIHSSKSPWGWYSG